MAGAAGSGGGLADERQATRAVPGLAELRRILGLLRTPDNSAQWRPPPSLDQLAELVSGYRTAGMPVRLEFTGEVRPLAGGLELSAYRIVEEALANVLKHTDPTQVTVTLHYGRTQLDVTSKTTAAAATRSRRPAGTASSGCGSVRRWQAAAWTPAVPPTDSW
ncbi:MULTISPECIES: hypothetical protein [unclassified Streptomyces]|uniref:sensor histidine kinase n=1 Tax=unclassified Streptomyces TaxID=2593676 RepID=UPI00336AA5CE